MSELFPRKRELDVLVGDNFSELTTILDETFAAGDTFTDDRLEQENFAKMFEYVDFLTKALCDGDIVQPGWRVAWESVHFAYAAASNLMQQEVRISPHEYFRELPGFSSHQELAGRLAADAQEYLQHRQAVDHLIAYAMPELDPTGGHEELAETTAALTFLQIEKSARLAHADKQAGPLIGEIERFLSES